MREIPFSPEMMALFPAGCAGLDGSPIEGNSNTEQIEALKEALPKALEELTERQLECVQMYFWDGMTQVEIANEIGTSQKVVAIHLQRAIGKMKKSKSFSHIRL